MNKIFKTITVRTGYECGEKAFTLDAKAAQKMLNTRCQTKCTVATIDNDRARIIQHYLTCPYCGHRLPAYNKYLDLEYEYEPKRMPKDIIDNWGKNQYSIFEDAYETLYLNEPQLDIDEYECRKCKRIVKKPNANREVHISYSNKKLEVSTRIVDNNDYLSIKWLDDVHIDDFDEAYETVVFNFRNGHTYIKITKNDFVVGTQDITNCPERFNEQELYSMINDYTIIKREIKHIFEGVWNKSLPFNNAEICFEKFMLMTRFIGYNKDFYYSIPFIKGTYRIDPSFKRAYRLVHKRSTALNFLEKKPYINCIGFYENILFDCGKLFYLNEIDAIYDIIGDDNYFERIIRCDNIYQLLTMFKTYPGSKQLYYDYRKINNRLDDLMVMLVYMPVYHRDYAIDYAAMSESRKRYEQKLWPELVMPFFEYMNHFLNQPYDVPLRNSDKKIADCTIDGYDFVWLRTAYDYEKINSDLKGVWIDYDVSNMAYIGMQKDGVNVALIEYNLEKRVVTSAESRDDNNLFKNVTLYDVFEKWARIKNVELDHPLYWED